MLYLAAGTILSAILISLSGPFAYLPMDAQYGKYFELVGLSFSYVALVFIAAIALAHKERAPSFFKSIALLYEPKLKELIVAFALFGLLFIFSEPLAEFVTFKPFRDALEIARR